MRLAEIFDNQNFMAMLQDMMEPATKKPPREKGADAILVRGYVVHGHWRKRVIPMRNGRIKPVEEA